jgi:2-polyprenyl-3-methyl-5-hydroxy-6-metoxy-1,4-benzoquinol methylase
MNCVDHTVSKEAFPISECEKCKFLFTNPIPPLSELGSYYESEDYISHSNSKKGLFNSLYQFVRLFTIKSKLQLIGKPKGQLLEIGCGTGELLHAAQKAGWKVQGVEPSENARKQAIDNYNLPILPSIEELKIEENSQDTIMLWHVIEHIPNLNEVLEKFSKWLKEDGQLIMATPNHKSWDAQHYKENWAAYDVPRHLYHYSAQSMKELGDKHKLTLIKRKGMPFDAYYVSMLSEKIKSGKVKILKGACNGLRSNLHAFFKSGEYSSMIYIMKAKKA